MPFFDPQPTPAETNFWLFRPGGRHKVSRWPTMGTNRTNVRFRFPSSLQFDSNAVRWLVHLRAMSPLIDPEQPTADLWGWADLDWDDTEQELDSGLIGEVDDWTFRLFLQDHEVDGDEPVKTVLRMNYESPAGPFQASGQTFITFNKDGNPSKPSIYTDVDPNDGRVDQLDWSMFYGNWLAEAYSVSDCYSFPYVGIPVGGFGEIAPLQWISFGEFSNPGTTQFRAEWTVRPYNDTDLPVMSLSNFQSAYSGHTGLGNCRWWNRIMNFLEPMVIGEWHDIAIEWNFSVLDSNFRWWKNGILQGSFVDAGQNAPFDLFGWHLGNGPGRFDLRDLKIWVGNPPAQILIHDFPLSDDACDLGLLAFKGTTHNMPLPSCP